MIDRTAIDPRTDYYAILGVGKDATTEKIKLAFKRLAMRHHPDRGGDTEAFKRINSAHQVIGDPESRRYYDQIRSEYSSGDEWWDYTKYGMTREEYFSDPAKAGLRQFVIQSLFIFQDQLEMIIPGAVIHDFETAVQYVYDTWGEIKKTRRIVVQRFAGMKVTKETTDGVR